ncbi:helix-turn-helix transcriptional regulator [Novosphingobium flavum]|uniref:helix-turn-helix domain-containing protein n=1 Tax=Novosphingobium aerophilum TaxID=2839843 RepID=UPI00163B3829|nr:helix-turn-helix transcriptional regulator [Novosphingobium aerophilum]MBC2662792.1 helix-turn-helix transcriptional regulator [Novosphingobium aerophilum]
MKLSITREWFEQNIGLEGDSEIGVGPLARDPRSEQADDRPAGENLDPSRVAFSSLVEYMRRKQGLSMEKLAEQAEIDIAEVVSIERDAHYRPEPRTVFQLARMFNLPNKALLQLSGNAIAQDNAVQEHALRFAARSGGSVQSLSREEKRALEEFVAFLAKH